jgi:hypothetical protein
MDVPKTAVTDLPALIGITTAGLLLVLSPAQSMKVQPEFAVALRVTDELIRYEPLGGVFVTVPPPGMETISGKYVRFTGVMLAELT